MDTSRRINGWRFGLGVVILAQASLAFWTVWRQDFAAYPQIDDTYYGFSIARNIGIGKGITYEGIQTNGFQPLSVFFNSMCFLLYPHDHWFPVRLATTFNIFFWLATIGILREICRLLFVGLSAKAECVLLMIWTSSPFLLAHSLNGLETGLNLSMLTLTFWFYLAHVRHLETIRPVTMILFGVMLGICGLARVDSLLFAAGIGLDYLIVKKSTWFLAIGRLVLVFSVASLIASPWVLYNFSQFGSVMPSSGPATMHPITTDGFSMYYNAKYIADALVSNPLFGFAGRAVSSAGLMWSGLMLAFFVGVGWWCLTRNDDANRSALMLCAALTLLYAFVYGLWLEAYFFFYRYLMPTYLFMFLFIAIMVVRIVRWIQTKSAVLRRASLTLFACWLVGNCVFYVWNISRRHETDMVWQKRLVSQWIRMHIPRDQVVGAFQSGVIGYMCPHRIVNLDGKVYARAYSMGKQGKLDEFLREENVTYLVDWDGFLQRYLFARYNLPVTKLAEIASDTVYRIDWDSETGETNSLQYVNRGSNVP